MSGYCKEPVDIDYLNGGEVWCEKPEDHDGDHATHLPEEDKPGLLWEKYTWGDAK